MPRHKIFMKSKSLPKVRGVLTYKEFEDSKGQKCIIQESSCVEKSLWLGLNDSGDVPYRCMRMHLNERQVKELIQDLQSWVENAI